MTGAPERGAVEPAPAPEDHRCREHERDPLPARELERREHREQRERDGERDRDDEPQRERAGRLLVPMPRLRRARVVARGLDDADELVDRDGRVVAHGRLLGREVHGRVDALQLVELPLDAGDARRARHALEIEANLLLILRRRLCRSAHVAS